uniref:G_PROTEIN_RECEP_F1_2 domain-containing protein n=1 Tax=Caenorhabditis tropicalis TaxID=1561998 RepID=A0A1I7UPY4_9PELO
MAIIVEFVPEEDTLAVVTIKETQSASLRTTNAILIAALLISSYFLNVLFVVAVFITKSFRTTIYLMYCHLSFVNIIDLSFNIFFALIFVANGNWYLSNGWCTFNVAIQEFTHLHTLFVLMIIGAERALGIILGPEYVTHGDKYLSGLRITVVSLILSFVSISFASVVFMSVIPIKPFRNRYVCGIDGGGPVGYVIARLIVYFGCLAVILVAIGAILQKRTASSISRNTQEYAEFIKRNRAMQEHRSRAKLMILITCVFICIEGPYITMCFFYETYNSREFSDISIDIPQDADTLITWLKFVFPLICPIIMLSWCNDVWTKVKEVMCCRSYDPPTIGHMPGYRDSNEIAPVMTVVGGEHGPQIKAENREYQLRPNLNPTPSVTSYESDAPSSVTQEANLPVPTTQQSSVASSSPSVSTPSPSETPKLVKTEVKTPRNTPSKIPRQISQFRPKN